MISERQATSIKVTASGIAFSRPCRLVGFSVQPAGSDLVASFHDGSGPNAMEQWSAEADAGAGSHAEHFSVPIPFTDKLYVQLSNADANQKVYVMILDGA